MHIKFLSHGTGDPQRARTYLLQVLDHNGLPRPDVRVLRGNPQQVADLAESLDFVHRYTSAVINWHPADEPSVEDVQAVLDGFELAAFSGMEPDQYAYTAISHGDHLHIFAARVELRTGLSHNMAPPSSKKVFEHLRNHWNFKRGWARPDDPRRARASQPEPTFKGNLSRARATHADELRNAFGVEPELNVRDERHTDVTAWISEQVVDGTIDSREDVLGALAKIGTLNRKGDDYVSVRFDDLEKPIRFKGTLFSTSFDAAAFRAKALQSFAVLVVGRDKPDPVRAADEKAAFDAAVAARSRYNLSRYRAPSPSPSLNPEKTLQADDGPDLSPKLIKENQDDRTGNPLVEEALRIFELSREAIRRLAGACRDAVESAGRIERASAALECAVGRFVQWSERLKKPKTRAAENLDRTSKSSSLGSWTEGTDDVVSSNHGGEGIRDLAHSVDRAVARMAPGERP